MTIVVAYHNVIKRALDEVDVSVGTKITAELFREHMTALKRSFAVLPLDALVDSLEDEHRHDGKVAITFDDGLKGVFDNAVPILDELHLPATWYVNTGMVGTDRLHWFNVLEAAFRISGESKLEIALATGTESYRLGTLEAIGKALRRVKKYTKTLPADNRQSFIDGVLQKLDVSYDTIAEYAASHHMQLVGWNELHSLRGTGISIGSHGVNHFELSRCTDEQSRHEIQESYREVVRRLGTNRISLAYPNGRQEDITEREKVFAQQAGYHSAVLCNGGTMGRERFALNRISLTQENPDVLAEIYKNIRGSE